MKKSLIHIYPMKFHKEPIFVSPSYEILSQVHICEKK